MTSTSKQRPGAINTGTRLKLSSMMFLEFFIWGAWFVTLGTLLLLSWRLRGARSALRI